MQFPIVGIGASAGGLEALRDMLSPAQAHTGMAFVIVQHLDPNHESMLAELLDRHTSLEVMQCEGGERIEPDTVHIIPPGHGLAIRDGTLQLTEFSQPRGLRRPIDDFFASLAEDQEGNAACVILSGTGADGTTGLRAVKEHGGVCVVQEPDTARYDGMPLSAVSTGLVDFVQPPGRILDCLTSFFSRRLGGDEEDESAEEAKVVADHVDDLCGVLRETVGHDFSGYKRTTFVRRVERRMQVLGIDSGRIYLSRLKSDDGECHALFRDLLINVTRFFRDSEAFDALRRRVVDPLVQDRETGEEIRVWVPGCSSGEEAYSIAMMFAEAAREADRPLDLQIIATDIDEQMLSVAREASYPSAALADIPYEMRERYTIPHADRFTITPQIRDMVRISNHSLVKDPPFAKVDLVSCRNLLIYFDDSLQQSVMPLLHYSVRPDGYLFLGPSESIGRFEELFAPLDHQARLFTRNPGPVVYPIDMPTTAQRKPARDTARRRDSQPVADEVAVERLLDRYAPASIVVDGEGGIVAAYGRLSRYFEFPVTRTGRSNAIALARPGLRAVLGPLLRQVRSSRKRAIGRDVEIMSEYGRQIADVLCEPLPDRTYLVVFREQQPFDPSFDPDLAELETENDQTEALEGELRAMRHRLRSTVEELETANEELKSSNEEMMSMNEELQSTNEELATVNDELKSKVDQLTVANTDLRNFFDSTELAVIVVDEQLRVRSYTKAAQAIFPLAQSDRGRSFEDVASKLSSTVYLDDARAVVAGHDAIQRRVTSREGARTYALRTLPYEGQEGAVEGATLILTDVTDALSLEKDLAQERQRLDMAIQAAGMAVWEYRTEGNLLLIDAVGQEMLGLDEGEVPMDRFIGLIHAEDRSNVETRLRQAVAGDADMEVTFRLPGPKGATRWVKSFGRLVDGGKPRAVVGISIDVTPEHALAETRELMLREMNHRVKNLFAVIAGMVSAAARTHDSITEFSADLRDRIAGLGRAHSLSTSAPQAQDLRLRALIETVIAPYEGHCEIVIEGDDVALDRNCLSPFALILHEWATNSVKHGALGKAAARLTVECSRSENGVHLSWRESGTESVSREPSSGFGTLLVDLSVRQLNGSLQREVADGSFSLVLDLPESVVASA